MIQCETNRATQVKTRFLREYNIKVVDDWISGCISFCLQENPKTSNESLFKFAFDQWILADLKEIGVSSLPESIDTETNSFMLNGRFPLQLNYLVDISEPCYDQLRNLYNKKMDEADEEIQMRKTQTQHIKKKRMLKLELTDGKRTVVGMEHNPIAVLNTKLPPGVKIFLTGPIRCINKVLFLEPKNVRILGGEVDTMLITNAFENILLKALGQPLNPNPKTEYDEPVVVEKNRDTMYNNIQPIPMVFASPVKPLTDRPSEDWEDDVFLGINLDGIDGIEQNKERVEKPPEQVPTISTLMDDDDDLVQIELPEREIMNQQVSSTKTSQPSPSSSRTKPSAVKQPNLEYPDDDIDAMNFLEDEIRNEQRHLINPIMDEEPTNLASNHSTPVQPAKRPRLASVESTANLVIESQQPSTSKNFDKCSVSAFFEDSLDGDAFQIEDISASGMDDILSPRYQFQVDSYSLATVTQLNELSDAEREERTFVVFGEVEEVFERIRVSDDGWKLGVMITDRSERCLPVRFHTTVISKMVGHDASSIQQMKRARNPQVMKLLEEILIKFKNQLQELRTFLRIRYHQGNDFPFVMELYESTRSRLVVLHNKIKKENVKHLLEILPEECDTVS
ncbi:recQ-mediated genome instability protein 1-like [Topomyia yanbarensis]|uniref:recQ-mediated genome instability protein 1-like n=1 Tax=Topomyia yanbarensis TaxID=2498891 RepID=UPI00273AB52A|nr:recQ-mediated genome instability protein 1-like [Topomyia yanbarensis]